MNCVERDCQNDAHTELYDVFGNVYCPQCWLRLLPPTNQFDIQRHTDDRARNLLATQ